MANNNIWTILAVSLVVAVIASVVTANITGNTISVARGVAGKVYTTSEIDAKFKQLGPAAYWSNITNADYNNLKGISRGIMPKNCMAHSFTASAFKDGKDLCIKQTNNQCLVSEVTLVGTNKSSSALIALESRFLSCDYKFLDFDEDTEGKIPGIALTKSFEVICCD